MTSALLLMLVNGWTDAPVNIATAIHSGAVKPKTAVLLSAICNFSGAVAMSVFGSAVAVNIYSISGLSSIKSNALIALVAAVLSVVVWSLFALKFGLPTSESHALMAALSGSAVAVGGFSAVNGAEWLKALLGIVLSTLPVAVLSFLVSAIFNLRLKLPSSAFRKLQVVGAALSSFSHGAQDGQKLAGVLTLAAVLTNPDRPQTVAVPLWAVLTSATVISLGTLLGGKSIIKRFSKFAPSNPALGFASDLVSAIGLSVLSICGLPASTTHAKSSAVLGAGLLESRLTAQLKSFRWMVLAWILTFPVSFVLGFALTEILSVFF